MNITRPPRLNHHDKIGIVSLASPLAHDVPHRVDRGIKALRALGFKPVIGNHALNKNGLHSGTPEERASDVNHFISDPSIKAIFTFIGGYGVSSILEHIDYECVRINPKIFVGHSESALLNLALYSKANLVSFYGPHILTQFGEHHPHSYTTSHFMKAVTTNKSLGAIQPSQAWSDDFFDWFTQDGGSHSKQWHPNNGYKVLREGTTEGVILGGCLDPIHGLKGTDFWPNFQDSIFFLELSPSPDHPAKPYPLNAVYAQIQSLSLCGVFDKISGLVMGRPVNYNLQDKQALESIILDITGKHNFPILFDADIGHTDPMTTLPIGVRGRIDTSNHSFEVIQPHLC